MVAFEVGLKDLCVTENAVRSIADSKNKHGRKAILLAVLASKQTTWRAFFAEYQTEAGCMPSEWHAFAQWASGKLDIVNAYGLIDTTNIVELLRLANVEIPESYDPTADPRNAGVTPFRRIMRNRKKFLAKLLSGDFVGGAPSLEEFCAKYMCPRSDIPVFVAVIRASRYDEKRHTFDRRELLENLKKLGFTNVDKYYESDSMKQMTVGVEQLESTKKGDEMSLKNVEEIMEAGKALAVTTPPPPRRPASLSPMPPRPPSSRSRVTTPPVQPPSRSTPRTPVRTAPPAMKPPARPASVPPPPPARPAPPPPSANVTVTYTQNSVFEMLYVVGDELERMRIGDGSLLPFSLVRLFVAAYTGTIDLSGFLNLLKVKGLIEFVEDAAVRVTTIEVDAGTRGTGAPERWSDVRIKRFVQDYLADEKNAKTAHAEIARAKGEKPSAPTPEAPSPAAEQSAPLVESPFIDQPSVEPIVPLTETVVIASAPVVDEPATPAAPPEEPAKEPEVVTSESAPVVTATLPPPAPEPVVEDPPSEVPRSAVETLPNSIGTVPVQGEATLQGGETVEQVRDGTAEDVVAGPKGSGRKFVAPGIKAVPEKLRAMPAAMKGGGNLTQRIEAARNQKRVYDALLKRKELTVVELEEVLGLGQENIGRYVIDLRDAGLIRLTGDFRNRSPLYGPNSSGEVITEIPEELKDMPGASGENAFAVRLTIAMQQMTIVRMAHKIGEPFVIAEIAERMPDIPRSRIVEYLRELDRAGIGVKRTGNFRRAKGQTAGRTAVEWVAFGKLPEAKKEAAPTPVVEAPKAATASVAAPSAPRPPEPAVAPAPIVVMPTQADIDAMVRKSWEALKSERQAEIDVMVQGAMERIVPDMMDRSLKTVMDENMPAFVEAVINEIKKRIPGLAEEMVQGAVEKAANEILPRMVAEVFEKGTQRLARERAQALRDKREEVEKLRRQLAAAEADLEVVVSGADIARGIHDAVTGDDKKG